jgi:hypothetical protein
MTTREQLEQMIERVGLNGVLTLLALICGDWAERDAVERHNIAAAKNWTRCANALDAVIINLWGRL